MCWCDCCREFLARAGLQNYTLGTVPLPLVWYRKHAGERISTSNKSSLFSHFRAALPYYVHASSPAPGLAELLLYVKGQSLQTAQL
jgi:hypothetical protein